VNRDCPGLREYDIAFETGVDAGQRGVDAFTFEDGHESQVGRFQHSNHSVDIRFEFGEVDHGRMIVKASFNEDVRTRDGAEDIRILERENIGRRTEIENFLGRELQ